MPATLAPPNARKRQVSRSARPQRVTPLESESQIDFVDRCRRQLRGSTDEVVAYAYREWKSAGREDEVNAIAERQFPQERFKRVNNRPVFVEHTKTRVVTHPETGEQREVTEVYDRRTLEGMVRRCNERILDTGDFSPIIDGHTPEPEAVENGVRMPDVLGYSGPYRMGIVGNRNPKYAIFCDEWHHKDCLDRLDKLQRRSPEVWMEDNISDRFFDPIAALGSSTPRLDMGLTQFARTADGRLVEKYSAVPVTPSGSSTFIPGDNGERRRTDKLEAGEPNMLSPEDVKQIVTALKQTDVWQWAQSQMQASEDTGIVDHNEADDVDPPLIPPSGATDHVEDQQLKHYECDDDDTDMVAQYMSGEADDEQLTEYMRSKRGHYQAEGSAEDGDPGHPAGDPSVAEGKLSYSRTSSREGGDMAVKYHRLLKEHTDLKQRVQGLEGQNRDKYRRARLSQRQAEGVIFDMDDEWEVVKGMTDKQFDQHVDRTMEKYERAPMSHVFPSLPTPDLPAPDSKKTQKYARERSDMIQKLILSSRERGTELSWEEAAVKVDSAA